MAKAILAIAALALISAGSPDKTKPLPPDDPADVKILQAPCPDDLDVDQDGNITGIRVKNMRFYGEKIRAAEHALVRLRHVRSLAISESSVPLEFVKSWAAVEQIDVEGANDDLLTNIEGMQTLRRLWIHRMFVTDEGVRSIAKLKNLELLVLERAHVTNACLTDACVKDIASLPRLKHLDLRDSAITDQGVAQLTRMKLEFLGLAGTKISDRGIDEIKGMVGLKEIDIDDTNVTSAALARLNGVRGLKVFGLPSGEEPGKKAKPNPPDEPADVAELLHFYPQLKLDVEGNVAEFDPEPSILERFPKVEAAVRRLRHVRAASVRSDADHLLPDLIKNWSELETLVVESAGGDSLSNLTGRRKLKWLDIQHCHVDAETIARLKTLERLIIRQSRLTDGSMKAIARLPRLKYLDLRDNPISDEGLKQLKGTRLEFLGLCSTRITDRGLDELTDMTTLRELDVGLTKATNAERAKLLWAIPGLKVIGLPRVEAHEVPDDPADVAAIRDVGVYLEKDNATNNVYKVHADDRHGEPRDWMEHLKGLHSVKELRLQEETSGDALKYLAGMKSLESLLICGHFSEEGLRPIATLTNLKSLSFHRAGIAPESAKYLAPLLNLEYLYLGGEPIGDDGLRYLAGIKRLKELFLDETKISDAGLVHLRGLTTLKKLSLARTGITNAGLVHLKGLTALEEIDLWQAAVTGDGLQALRGLKNLSSISCEHSREAQIRLRREGLYHLAIPRE